MYKKRGTTIVSTNYWKELFNAAVFTCLFILLSSLTGNVQYFQILFLPADEPPTNPSTT